MRGMIVISALSLCLIGCAQQQFGQKQPATEGEVVSRQALAHPAWPYETVKYRCEDGVELQVAYLNLEDGESYVALYYDGTLSLMRQWPAASGARYISMDEQVGLRWHTKYDWGMLSFLAADHTAEEITLLADCEAVPDT